MQVTLIALTNYFGNYDDSDNTNPTEALIEHAGRVCYRSTGESGRFVQKRIAAGHESIIEHASATFEISGISRACSHQLVRHRIASFCIDGDAMTELTSMNRSIKRRTVKELFDIKNRRYSKGRLQLVKLNCLNEETGRIVQGRVKDVVYCGSKECLEFEVGDDYRLRATENHLFFTQQGWKQLGEILREGLEIAVNGIPLPSGEWLIEEYLTKNRMRTDIARELGVSDSWLGKVIRKLHLQKPKNQYPNPHPGHGKPGMHTPEGLAIMSKSKSGSRNHRWRGGITCRAVQLRMQVSGSLRKEIYERDDFTCRLCKQRGGKLTLHHIVPLWQNEDLVADKQNLVTLCAACHHKVDGREHEYADYFGSLEPVQPQIRVAARINRTLATFRPITAWKSIGCIDTYDIVMKEPYHNFIANGIITHNSQESQRYVDMEMFHAIIPQSVADSQGAKDIWYDTVFAIRDAYNRLLSLDIPKEDARFLLPNATATRIVMTMNFRELRHFFKVRLQPAAQWEIRNMAAEMLRTMLEEAPAVFGDLEELIC